MPTPVLKTRFSFPPARPRLTPRPRLVERLSQGLHGPLTLISAPAGSGKTTLMSEWRAGPGRGLPVAWLTLDPSDNDPARFLLYLISAVDVIRPGSTGGALSLLNSPQPAPTDTVLTTFINEVSAISKNITPEEIILVLDDYHHVTNPAVHNLFAFLLDHRPDNLHLVLLTRGDPPLPLARLRARGQLTEIRATDLRFLPDEVSRFLKETMDIDLPAEAVTALESRTEGWIAGLQLAAVALQNIQMQECSPAKTADFIAHFTGSHHYIVDYLLEEVLDQQPKEVRDFLLRTSILDWMSGSLCEAVIRRRQGLETGREDFRAGVDDEIPLTTDSQSLLKQLVRENLFVIPLDETGEWFRYHTLFVDLLRQRLKQSVPAAEIQALHARAAAWYEQQGYTIEAVNHLLAAPDFDRAAALLARQAIELIFLGEVRQVKQWIEALPEPLVLADANLCLAYAWTLYLNALFADAEQWLAAAGQAKSTTGQDSPAFDATAAALRAYLAFDSKADVQGAIGYASEALAHFSETLDWIHCAMLFLLGQAHMAIGEYHAAEQALEKAQRVAAKTGNAIILYGSLYLLATLARERGALHTCANLCRSALRSVENTRRPVPSAGILSSVFGSILVEKNDLDAAEPYLRDGLALCARVDSKAFQMEGYVGMIRLKAAQRDFDGAYDLLERGASTVIDLYFNALRAQLWIQEAEHAPESLALAARWGEESAVSFEQTRPIRSIAPLINRDVERLTLARLHIAQLIHSSDPPDPQPLLDYLESAVQQAEEAGWRLRVIEVLILQAMALQSAGRGPVAMLPFKRALALAEPEGFVRIFLDEGQPAARLLEEAARRKIMPSYVERLLAAFDSQSPQAAEPEGVSMQVKNTSALSERELEVLRLLASGCTNKEIASRLVISIETAKRHITHIFHKLDAKNRTEAVARARESRLV